MAYVARHFREKEVFNIDLFVINFANRILKNRCIFNNIPETGQRRL